MGTTPAEEGGRIARAAPLSYVHCDVPEGLTLDQWRRLGGRPVPPRRFGVPRVRELRRAGRTAGTA
jgi:hypothetical protein